MLRCCAANRTKLLFGGKEQFRRAKPQSNKNRSVTEGRRLQLGSLGGPHSLSFLFSCFLSSIFSLPLLFLSCGGGGRAAELPARRPTCLKCGLQSLLPIHKSFNTTARSIELTNTRVKKKKENKSAASTGSIDCGPVVHASSQTSVRPCRPHPIAKGGGTEEDKRAILQLLGHLRRLHVSFLSLCVRPQPCSISTDDDRERREKKINFKKNERYT